MRTAAGRSAAYYLTVADAIEAEGGLLLTKPGPVPSPEAQQRQAARVGRRIRRQFGAMAMAVKVTSTKVLASMRSTSRPRSARTMRRVRRRLQRRARAPDPDDPEPGGARLETLDQEAE